MDDIFTPPRPSTVALRQIVQDSIVQCDRLLRESLDHATWLETELARERRRLVYRLNSGVPGGLIAGRPLE